MSVARNAPQSLETLENRTLLSVGDLDPAFGGGIVTRDILGGGDFGFASVVQNDGKVLVAGRAAGTSGNDFAVVRYLADGTLDSSFGVGGIALTDMGSPADGAYTIAVQGDGKILVAGETTVAGQSSNFALARYNPDGTLDSSFGVGGRVVTDFAGGADQARSLAVAPSGDIVVAGWASVAGLPRFAVAKYDAGGQLAAGFGPAADGKLTTPYGGGYAMGADVVVLSDGSILVAGSAFDGSTGESHMAVTRYTSSGALDSSFGAGGFAVVDLGRDVETAASMAVQSDGRIVLAGRYEDSITWEADFVVARMLPNGTLDTSFGAGGRSFTDFGNDLDEATSLALQSDGRIVVAGLAWVDGASTIGIARYNPDGSPDASFAGGSVSLGIGAEAVGNAVALDPAGNIVVAGFTTDDFSNYNFAAARLIGKINVAPTANPGNAYTVDAGSSAVLNGSGSFDSDGSIVSYEWDFDYDGMTFNVDTTGATPIFSAAGLSNITRSIALRVIDDNGAVSIATTTLIVNPLPPPPPPPTTPPTTPDGVKLENDPSRPGKKVLIVNGTKKNDSISFIGLKKGVIEVRMNGRKLGRYTNISRVVAYGGDGKDIIKACELAVPVEFYGGKGNDHLVGTKFGDILIGGDGDDRLYGWHGDDLIVGGKGRDHLHSVFGADLLIGGSLKCESDPVALRQMLADWTRKGCSHKQRMDKLKLSSKVIDDASRDMLIGTPNVDGIFAGKGDKLLRIKSR